VIKSSVPVAGVVPANKNFPLSNPMSPVKSISADNWMVPARVPSLTQTDWSVLDAKIDLVLFNGETNERLRFELISVTWADAANVSQTKMKVSKDCFMNLFYFNEYNKITFETEENGRILKVWIRKGGSEKYKRFLKVSQKVWMM
jgi:hypothetical protein